MKKIVFLAAIVISALLSSCESPLSEQSISDPSIIHPMLQVYKGTDDKGTTYYNYRCDIFDKYLRSVELKDGDVMVNGMKLMVIKNALGTYYLLDDTNLKYALNTKYYFTITLSDQSQYAATVTTHPDTLRDFLVPAEHPRSQNLKVSWKGTSNNASMFLSVVSNFKTDSSFGFSSRRIEITNPSTGTYELTPTDFNYKDGGTYSVELTLHSEINGTMDDRFGENRRSFSHQSITRTIAIQ